MVPAFLWISSLHLLDPPTSWTNPKTRTNRDPSTRSLHLHLLEMLSSWKTRWKSTMFRNFPDIWWFWVRFSQIRFNDQQTPPKSLIFNRCCPPGGNPYQFATLWLQPRNPYHQPPPSTGHITVNSTPPWGLRNILQGLPGSKPIGFLAKLKWMRLEERKTSTLPRTNILHLKIGHPKREVVFQPSIFRCYVSFREGRKTLETSTFCWRKMT